MLFIFLYINCNSPDFKKSQCQIERWLDNLCKCHSVLVLSGCCNKMPQTGQLTDNTNVFLTVLEAEEFKIRVAARSHCGERSFPGSQLVAFAMSLCGERGQGPLWSLSYEVLIPFMKAKPECLPKAPTSWYHHL